MIVVTATLWPRGNQSQSVEILNATISNTSSPGDAAESYSAHVLARPNLDKGCIGFEADVEVREHLYQNGFTPLLISVLAAAMKDDHDIFIPPSRALNRATLREIIEFDQRLKGRT